MLLSHRPRPSPRPGCGPGGSMRLRPPPAATLTRAGWAEEGPRWFLWREHRMISDSTGVLPGCPCSRWRPVLSARHTHVRRRSKLHARPRFPQSRHKSCHHGFPGGRFERNRAAGGEHVQACGTVVLWRLLSGPRSRPWLLPKRLALPWRVLWLLSLVPIFIVKIRFPGGSSYAAITETSRALPVSAQMVSVGCTLQGL